MKKKGNFRKVVSGLLAGMTMLSTVLSPMTAYAAEIQPEEKPPLYEEVKDLLDEDEVVTAKDYEIETGSVFDVKSDYTGLEIKDADKVKVTFEEAKNDKDEDFTTDHADTYKAVYYVEPVNQEHPKYQISRKLIVREKETEVQTETAGSEAVTESETAGSEKQTEEAGLTALLGCGFDPGVTQAYCAYAKKHEFDTIDTIDILDCNGGDHGYAFATNFNPEVNLREVSAPGSYIENGKWVEIPAMSIKREYNFDSVGEKDMYLLHHEELESLAVNIPEVKRIRFFMTFGQSYLTHMKCLENVGMLSTTPVNFEGHEIVPIKFLKELLPDPASLGPRTHGKTNIGCIFTGKKDGKDKTYYIYNVCDHQECYKEVESQAISFTTGVPAMCGALMLLTKKWDKPGVYTVEEFDPDPFLDALDKYGLPRRENHNPVLVD